MLGIQSDDKEVVEWFTQVQKISSSLEEVCHGNFDLMIRTCICIIHDISEAVEIPEKYVIKTLKEMYKAKREINGGKA